MSNVTRFGPSPLLDNEIANKAYVDAGGGGGGVLSVIETYEASIAEGSHTFTFAGIDFDDDSELLLVYDLSATAAFSLLMRINGITALSYFVDGRRITGGAETLIDLNSLGSGQLQSSTIINGANSGATGRVKIGLIKAGTNDKPTWSAEGSGSALAGGEVYSGLLFVNMASITSIRIFTSTSTWQIGTRMTLYRLARA